MSSLKSCIMYLLQPAVGNEHLLAFDLAVTTAVAILDACTNANAEHYSSSRSSVD